MPVRGQRLPTRKGAPARWSAPTNDPLLVQRERQIRNSDNHIFNKIKIQPAKGLSHESELVTNVANHNNINFDANSAIQNQEQNKQQKWNDIKHNINLMLNSLETISAGYGLFSRPWLWLAKKRLPSTLLQRAGDSLANTGLASQRNAQLPSLYMDFVERNTQYPMRQLQKTNNIFGNFIDGAQMLFNDNPKQRMINGTQLATSIIPNTQLRNNLQYLWNGYDFLNNTGYLK